MTVIPGMLRLVLREVGVAGCGCGGGGTSRDDPEFSVRGADVVVTTGGSRVVIVPEGGGEGGLSRVVPSISVRADSAVVLTSDGEVVGGGGGGRSRVVSSTSVRADSVGFTTDVEVVFGASFCTSMMRDDVTVRALTGT
jgi:hypothetical protein